VWAGDHTRSVLLQMANMFRVVMIHRLTPDYGVNWPGVSPRPAQRGSPRNLAAAKMNTCRYDMRAAIGRGAEVNGAGSLATTAGECRWRGRSRCPLRGPEL